jgi:Cu/Ag efflux protein CusF
MKTMTLLAAAGVLASFMLPPWPRRHLLRVAPPAAASVAAAPRTAGEVRRVDAAQGKLTLRHERIESLDMPAMTMVFQVADPKLLEGLQAGDKVRFAAEKRGGAYTVTALEVVALKPAPGWAVMPAAR